MISTSQSVECKPCPLCRKNLPDQPTLCPHCKTPHHQECWDYSGGCTIYGCDSENKGLAKKVKDLKQQLDVLLVGGGQNPIYKDVRGRAETLYNSFEYGYIPAVLIADNLQRELGELKNGMVNGIRESPIINQENLERCVGSLEETSRTLRIESAYTSPLEVLAEKVGIKVNLHEAFQMIEQREHDRSRGLQGALFMMGGIALVSGNFFLGAITALGVLGVEYFSRIMIKRAVKDSYTQLLKKIQPKLPLLGLGHYLPAPDEQPQIEGTQTAQIEGPQPGGKASPLYLTDQKKSGPMDSPDSTTTLEKTIQGD